MTIEGNTATSAKPNQRRRRWPFVLPVVAFVAIAAFLGVGLLLNPREIPSALIGQPVPEFTLPALYESAPPLSNTDFLGEVVLLNFFASWCVPCRVEHPLFMRLQREGVVPIYGVNFKDAPEDAKDWLELFGDPYTRIGADQIGRTAINLGVYGLPETFVIDRKGLIAYKRVGAISPKILEKEILPLIKELRK